MKCGGFFFFSYFLLFFYFFFGRRSWFLKIPSGPLSSVVRLYIYMCVCLMKPKGGLSVRGFHATLCFD